MPESLNRLADDAFYQAHEELSRVTPADIRQSMPKVQHIGDPATHAGYVDLLPQDVDDPRKAVVMPLPFANDWGPNMALRTRFVQQVLPHRRVIVFPNNSMYDPNVYALNTKERYTVASGNFEPLATRQLQTLEGLGVERIQYFGYSQGASVGAVAARLAAQRGVLGLGNSGFVEAPNVMQRGPKQLRKDFMVPLGRFNQAINDSAIPALSEILYAREGWDRARQLRMFLGFARGARLPDNRALHRGFGHETFAGDIAGVLRKAAQIRLLVGQAENSRIMPVDAAGTKKVYELQRSEANGRNRLDVVTIPEYGHEAGDNIALHALLARAALSSSNR